MLGQSFFRDFQEDPFFSHRQHMQQMQSMLVDPFAMHRNMLAGNQAVEQGQGHGHSHAHAHGHGHSNRHRRRQQEVVPFGMFSPSFGFGDMFSNMRRMMNDMHRSFDVAQIQTGPDTHMFTQSSYMSYSNTGQGQPKVYQATSSTRQAPGGVKETRRTVRDTESGMEKIAIGHHIGERAHIMERSRNRKTGDNSENQELINLDEEEAPSFDREWQEKTRYPAHHRHGERRARHNPIGNSRSTRPQLALPESRQRNRSHRDHE